MADDYSPVTQLLSQIVQLLTQQQAGGRPGAYAPTSAAFNGDPNTLFSFTQAMSQMGNLPGLAGTGADIFLQTTLPQIADRLQANAGVSMVERMQAREMQRAVMGFQVQGVGEAMAQGLGLGKEMAPFLGIAANMIPGAQSLAYLAAPTAMFSGGQNVVRALSYLDPMSQLRPGQAAAMRQAMYSLGTSGGGRFVNTEFTHGANLDELAEVAEFTADMGDTAIDLDIEGLRRRARGRGARTEAEITQGVEAERLTTAAGYNAQVAQATRSFLGPGAQMGDALNLMKAMGMSAQSQGEGNRLEGVMRQLEALGRQAGMTAQDMINAGRTLSAQTGMPISMGMAMAAQASAAERAIAFDARARGIETSPVAGMLAKTEITNQMGRFYDSSYMRSVAAIAGTSEAGREFIVRSIKSGNFDAIARRAEAVMNPQTSEDRAIAAAFNMSTEHRSMLLTGLFNDSGANMASMAPNMIANIARRRLGSFAGEFGALFGNKAFQADLAINLAAGNPLSQLGDKYGIGGASFARFSQLMNSAIGRELGTAVMGAYGNERLATTRDTRAENLKAMQDFQNAVRARGVGQGLLANLGAKQIGSFSDALEAMGFTSSSDQQHIYDIMSKGGLENPDAFKKQIVDAMEEKRKAARTALDPNSSQEEKEKAERALAKAQDKLDEFGFSQEGNSEQGKLLSKFITEGRKLNEPGRLPADGRADGATSGTKAIDVHFNEPTVTVVIKSEDGTVLKDEKIRLKASQEQSQHSHVTGGGPNE